MTEAQKEYEPVDWHGEHLRIDQDKKGYVSISHPPFETCFNPEEMREIAQFINEYCPVSAKSDAVLDELQLWRMKRMNGTLKKDVWQAWNEETDYINELRSQQKER